MPWGLPSIVGISAACRVNRRDVSVALTVGLALFAVLCFAMPCRGPPWALPWVVVVCHEHSSAAAQPPKRQITYFALGSPVT